jgi:protein prenyltransferase alpha subunit repeat containing protein 1
MSRALDAETTASVQKPLPAEIYKEIVSVLCTPRTSLLEIELLGKAHVMAPGQNYLLEDNYLAIPKVKLVQAFVVARQIFVKLFRNCPEGKEKDLEDATAIMLLMDPEHLTAANSRKRLLLRRMEDTDLKEILERELQFVDMYLTARLHRHIKSPNLWSHRRWLLQQYRSSNLGVSIKKTLEQVVLVAADRHPRNYYAWSHMRWLVDSFELNGGLKKEILPIVQDWCLRHPSDTSGFSFLLVCLEVPGRLQTDLNDIKHVYDHVLELALSFKWAHESVWTFLRTIAAAMDLSNELGLSFEEVINRILRGYAADNPKAQRTLAAAGKWFNENRKDDLSRGFS